MTPRHLLVLTYWRFDDALMQTYTLPYVHILLEALPPGSSIHLVTLELEADAGVTRRVSPGLTHVALRLYPFGPGQRRNGQRTLRSCACSSRENASTESMHGARLQVRSAWCSLV